jgi:hypothetical protein
MLSMMMKMCNEMLRRLRRSISLFVMVGMVRPYYFFVDSVEVRVVSRHILVKRE